MVTIYRSLIHDVRRVWLYAQPGSGEAAFDEQGLVLDLLQAVPDHLDQLGEAGHGGVGQDAALEYGPDPFHRVQVRGVGRELEDVQPWLGAGEGAQLRAAISRSRYSLQVNALVSPLRPRYRCSR